MQSALPWTSPTLRLGPSVLFTLEIQTLEAVQTRNRITVSNKLEIFKKNSDYACRRETPPTLKTVLRISLHWGIAAWETLEFWFGSCKESKTLIVPAIITWTDTVIVQYKLLKRIRTAATCAKRKDCGEYVQNFIIRRRRAFDIKPQFLESVESVDFKNWKYHLLQIYNNSTNSFR